MSGTRCGDLDCANLGERVPADHQHIAYARPDVKVIRMSDVGRCPKNSLLPSHFHADGTCKCSEREDADAAIAAAEVAAADAREALRQAREWRKST